MTRQEIIERIEGISKTLKGQRISYFERRLLNHDRYDLRKMLERLPLSDPSESPTQPTPGTQGGTK